MAPDSPRPRATLTLLALVVLGGTLGGLARTGVLELTGAESSTTALLGVNVLGSGLLGLLVGAARPHVAAWLRPFAGTGILGGFTTYSAAMAAVESIGAGSGALPAAGYLTGSLAGSVLAAALGLGLGLRLARRRAPQTGLSREAHAP